MNFSPLPAALLLTVFTLTATAPSASAEPATQAVKLLRDRTPAERPQLMLVGAPHFANYGRDVIKSQVPDVLEPQRQKEIVAVVEALARFNPTRIVVEWPAYEQAELDAQYQQYRAGNYVLSRSETDQLAMRLAAKLGHARIYAVDWNKMPPGVETDYDWQIWAESHGQQARLAAMRDRKVAQQTDALMQNTTVGEWLVYRNQPEQLEIDNRRYFDYAMLGDAVHNPGATWIGNWYARNLKILANLVTLADKPGDRLLVVYGSGHIFPLRQFAGQSGAFTLVDPIPLLNSAR